MSKLPIIDAKELERIIVKLGFLEVRQKGSHKFYRHPDGRYTTIPHHGNNDLSRPLIREILKQVAITTEEFIQLLNR